MPLTDDLDTLRAEAEALFLTDTATIKHPIKVKNGEGATVTTYQGTETVPCSVAPSGLTPQEREIATRLNAATTWIIRVPVTASIKGTDRLAVGSRVFNVIAPAGPRTLEVTRRLICVEV